MEQNISALKKSDAGYDCVLYSTQQAFLLSN